MTKPLPKCAYCGGSLIYKCRIVLHYGALPGAPDIGWHEECIKKDPHFNPLAGNAEAPALLKIIDAKGPGRVVRNKKSAKLSEARKEKEYVNA